MENNNQYQIPTPKKTNDWSIVSLIGGITGLTILPFLGSLFGVIGGNVAKKQIIESAGTQTGEDLAKWGVILGWIGIALAAIGVCAVIVLLIVFGTAIWSWAGVN